MDSHTREAWLTERRKGIGGSDAAAVFGEKYGCPRALFLDKTGVEPDYEHSEATLDMFERGHALEPIIAQRFTAETGLAVRRMPARVSKDRPWMRVNVDRIILTNDERGPGYLECKTANQHVFAEMLAHGLPEHYVLQAQHGLAVTGWQWGMFAVLEPYTFQFLCFEFKRNEQLIAVIEHVEAEFWQMVKAGQIPAALPDFNDQRCSKCVYRRGCRNAEALPKVKQRKPQYLTDDSSDLVALVGNIKLLDASIDNLQAQKDQEREKLRLYMGDRERVLCPEQGVKISFAMKSGAYRWDTRALDIEQASLAAKYKRRSEPTRELRMYDTAEAEE
jgi:putative phage-type endonuclease